jgi:hypothetical protein
MQAEYKRVAGTTGWLWYAKVIFRFALRAIITLLYATAWERREAGKEGTVEMSAGQLSIYQPSLAALNLGRESSHRRRSTKTETGRSLGSLDTDHDSYSISAGGHGGSGGGGQRHDGRRTPRDRRRGAHPSRTFSAGRSVVSCLPCLYLPTCNPSSYPLLSHLLVWPTCTKSPRSLNL